MNSRIRAARILRVEPLEHRRCLSGTPLPFAGLSQLAIDPTLYDDSSIIVRLRNDAEPLSEALDVLKTTPTIASTPLGFGMHKVKLGQDDSLEAMLAAFRRNPDVLYAEPDYFVSVAAIPDDPLFSEQWDFHNTGQLGGMMDADIDAPEAWDTSTGTGSTVVAVIDTGVDYLHRDLAPNMWSNSGEVPGNGIDDDHNGYVDDIHGYDFFNDDGDPRDDNNHGTHVAGTIAAEGNDDWGIAGVNWNAQIMAVKFLGADGSGTTSAAIEAVRYAVDNGAQISNNSWGGDPYSQALFDAIRDARDEGHIFVTAAGNGNWIGIGQDNDAAPFYPASYQLDNIVAVAATDRNDQRGYFSNFGSTSVDLGAPGVDILSTTINGGHGNSSGTSMATPHVTGALSLVRDFNPSLSYQQLIDRVLLSADPVDSMAGITVTGGRLNLEASLVPDTSGPQIIDVQPDGLVLDAFSSLRISFNETVDANTLTLDDVQLSGPQGDINLVSLVAVAGSNGRQFDLNLSPQSEAGTYELVVNPGISDRFGNAMDQNQNGTGGELPDDVFSHQFTKANAVARFDFGTASSPLAAEYTHVSSWDRYSAAVGHGWQTSAVYSVYRGGDALTGDLHYTRDATFAVDLPNGEYDLIVTMGEAILAHEQMGIHLEGIQVDSVSTAPYEYVINTYRTTVSDGQLNLRLQDLGGANPYAVINGLDIVFAGPDGTGPSVASTNATGTLTGPIDRITVSFSEQIQVGSFTLEDVSVLEGPSGAITPTAVNQLSGGEFEITFESQNDPGNLRLVIGPDILDVAGNPMDQDGDGVAGEPLEDQFETTFALEAGLPTVARFDFGTASSPRAADYTHVSSWDRYSAAVGHGWQTSAVYSVYRGGDALTGDLHYTRDATFAVDLPNGEYDLIVTMGEAIFTHEQMGVYLEGVHADTVSTAPYEYAINTYRTTVSDGQLNLRLQDLGGANPYAVINGLEIVFAGPDRTGPSILSTNATGTLTGPIDRITVSFSEQIQVGSFTLEDVSVLEGPSGAITPTAVNQLSGGEFEITFEAQNDPGDFRLVIGSDILDVAGNPMDQDGDGVAGEPLDDQFETTFTLEAGLPTVARFDFGTASSPLAADYTHVSSWDRYDAAVGHGWQTSAVYSVYRGGDALTGDLHYTPDATFAVDLPNGEYDLIVTMGEAIITHEQMGVYLEGVQVDTVSTAPYEYAINTYRATVRDGQLNLRLRDLGGANPYAVINGLEILYVGALQQASATSLSVAAGGQLRESDLGKGDGDQRQGPIVNGRSGSIAHRLPIPKRTRPLSTTADSNQRRARVGDRTIDETASLNKEAVDRILTIRFI